MDKSKLNVILALVGIPVFLIFLMIGFRLGKEGSIGMVLLALVAVFVAVGGLVIFFMSANKKEIRLTGAELADAQKLQAPAGKARLYIVRDGFAGGQQGMNITVGPNLVGQFKSGRALMADLPAGSHKITAQMTRGGKTPPAELTVDLAADNVTVVHARTVMGMASAAIQMDVLTDALAKEKLAKARFIAWLA